MLVGQAPSQGCGSADFLYLSAASSYGAGESSQALNKWEHFIQMTALSCYYQHSLTYAEIVERLRCEMIVSIEPESVLLSQLI